MRSRPLPLYLEELHLKSRYHPEMTSCPLYCIFKMGIRSGHHVVRFLWPLVWPHHGSPLLRVRGQQGMRAATRMTLARALQLVSTSLGHGQPGRQCRLSS